LVVKKIFKWMGFVAAGLVGLVLVGVVLLYVQSERVLSRHYEVAASAAVVVPTDPAEIAEGRRIAHFTGCTHCHGENLGGDVPLDIPNVVRFVAPNLTEARTQYTDAQLVMLLRKGVRPDGTSVLFMPSEMIRHLNDQDLGRVIAFVRSVPPTPGIAGKTEVRMVGRYILASGQFQSAAQMIEQAAPDVAPVSLSAQADRGRYLAMSACSECHGQDLNGNPAANAPPLVVAKGYSPDAFSRLMHEGVALGDRELELMSRTARARFSVLTPDETQAIHTFLQSRS
jgi:cytochrome c553